MRTGSLLGGSRDWRTGPPGLTSVANVPPPSPHSLIHFFGMYANVRPDGKLAVALDMVLYSPSATPASHSGDAPGSPSKRRKFNAFTAHSASATTEYVNASLFSVFRSLFSE